MVFTSMTIFFRACLRRKSKRWQLFEIRWPWLLFLAQLSPRLVSWLGFHLPVLYPFSLQIILIHCVQWPTSKSSRVYLGLLVEGEQWISDKIKTFGLHAFLLSKGSRFYHMIHNFTIRYLLEINENIYSQKTCMKMFIAVLFIIHTKNQHICLSIEEWINKL